MKFLNNLKSVIKHISVKIVFYSSNTSYKIPKLHFIHIRITVFIARDKQIISRQIDSFNQRTGAEYRPNKTFLKSSFYTKTNISRQITDMVRNAF